MVLGVSKTTIKCRGSLRVFTALSMLLSCSALLSCWWLMYYRESVRSKVNKGKRPRVKTTGNQVGASKNSSPIGASQTEYCNSALPISCDIMHKMSFSREARFEPGSPGFSSEVSSCLEHIIFLDSPKNKHVFDINHIICLDNKQTVQMQ